MTEHDHDRVVRETEQRAAQHHIENLRAENMRLLEMLADRASAHPPPESDRLDMLQRAFHRQREAVTELEAEVGKLRAENELLRKEQRGAVKLICILLRQRPNSELVLTKQEIVEFRVSGQLERYDRHDDGAVRWVWNDGPRR